MLIDRFGVSWMIHAVRRRLKSDTPEVRRCGTITWKATATGSILAGSGEPPPENEMRGSKTPRQGS